MAKNTLFGVVTAAMAWVIVSCENPFVRPIPEDHLDLVLELDAMPNVYSGNGRLIVYQTAYVEVQIFDGRSDIPLITRRLGVAEEGGKVLARGSFPALPQRSDYRLTARAYEGNGTLWVEGSTQFTLAPGKNTVTLRLSPVSSVIVSYPGTIGNLNSITIPPRRTLIYKLTVATAGYYTVDVLDSMGSNAPQLEASFNGNLFKEYQPYLGAHRVVGGMAAPGHDMIIAIGNSSNSSVNYHVLVQLDGVAPPDGKTLAVDLDYTGSSLTVNDKVVLALEAFPVPIICNNVSPQALITHLATAEGVVNLDQLAQYGRNTWVLRFVHDVNASQWFWGTLKTIEDLESFYRSDRSDETYLTSWTDVSTLGPTGPFPSLLLLDNTLAQVNLGGAAVDIKWKEATPFTPDVSEPNETHSTPSVISYAGPLSHSGYVATFDIHQKDDIDWVKFSALPYTDQYLASLVATDPSVPPLRVDFYKFSDLNTPVFSIQHASGSFHVRYRFSGQAGDVYYARVSSPWGAIGTSTSYKLELRLDDEDEEPEEGVLVNLSLLDSWREFRVSSSNGDQFSFTNPYPDTFQFLAVLDWPGPTYPRRDQADFELDAMWALGNTETLAFYNAHPAVSGSLTAFSTKTLEVTTPVNPGRRFRIKMHVWKDVNEPNDTHSSSKTLLQNDTFRYRSFHLDSDVDWYQVNITPGYTRRYRIRTMPSDVFPSLGSPTKFGLYDDLGNLLSGPHTKDAGGVSFAEITHSGKFKIQIEPDGPLGVYRIRINQRPDPTTRCAHWLFNGNLNAELGSALSGSGYEFVTGQNGVPASALRFDPSLDGKLQLNSMLPPPSTYLVFNFWMNVEIMPGADFSRGWVFAQEDGSGNLQFGIEIYQNAFGQPMLRLHNGGPFKEAVVTAGPGGWRHVAVTLNGYNTTEQVGAHINSANLINLDYWDANSTAPFATQAHIGGRAQAGTTLQGVTLDGFKVYNMDSPWQVYDYQGILEDPK